MKPLKQCFSGNLLEEKRKTVKQLFRRKARSENIVSNAHGKLRGQRLRQIAFGISIASEFPPDWKDSFLSAAPVAESQPAGNHLHNS